MKKKRVEIYGMVTVVYIYIIAERISARQPTPGHILAICVCTYVRVGHA